MMLGYVGSKLSENLARTPENFLLCLNVPVARTAERTPLLYSGSELGRPHLGNNIKVWRTRDALFERASIMSLEGKSITSPHPTRFLTAENASGYVKGHVQNVRPTREQLEDGESALLADLVIFCPMLIASIEDASVRDVSPGYNCRYRKLANGDFEQINISYNHLALVPQGRSGELVRVQDSEEEMKREESTQELMQQLVVLLTAHLRKQDGTGRIAQDKGDGLVQRIIAESRGVEDLLRRGAGAGEITDWFQQNIHDAERDYDAAQDFAQKANKRGRELRGQGASDRDCRSGLRHSAQDSEQSWEESMNRAGRAMRSA